MKRKIILASHGELAKGMKNSLEMITGMTLDNIIVFTLKTGYTTDEFKNQIENEINNNADFEYVIITDLYGASVNTSMYELIIYKNVKIFSGMNLNLVLSLILEHNRQLNIDDMKQIVNDGKQGIKYLTAHIEEDNDEFWFKRGHVCKVKIF